MSALKKIAISILIVFILLQFLPRSVNENKVILSTDISKKYRIPARVQQVLQRSCYDCHSNNTNYPWYAHIQPFRFVLDRHVRNGKTDLNFSEFASYSEKRQFNKLKAIGQSIKDETMPLKSYELFHSEARLTRSEKDLVMKWINDTRNSIETQNNE